MWLWAKSGHSSHQIALRHPDGQADGNNPHRYNRSSSGPAHGSILSRDGHLDAVAVVFPEVALR
jgi:hypothetical protein